MLKIEHKEVQRALVLMAIGSLLHRSEIDRILSHFDAYKLEVASTQHLDALSDAGMDDDATIEMFTELLKELYPEAVL